MITILMIEDEEDDAVMLQRAFKREGLISPIHIVTDGREGIRYLEGEGEYGQRDKFPFPQLVLLDLNMPIVGGFEVLEWRKNHPGCYFVPTLVVSASNQQADIQKAYELGANAYFIKPGSLEQLQKFARTIYDFWMSSAKPEITMAGPIT